MANSSFLEVPIFLCTGVTSDNFRTDGKVDDSIDMFIKFMYVKYMRCFVMPSLFNSFIKSGRFEREMNFRMF